MFPGITPEIHAERADFYMADAIIVIGTMTGKSPSVRLVRKELNR